MNDNFWLMYFWRKMKTLLLLVVILGLGLFVGSTATSVEVHWIGFGVAIMSAVIFAVEAIMLARKIDWSK